MAVAAAAAVSDRRDSVAGQAALLERCDREGVLWLQTSRIYFLY